jgi:hypothetical protein
MLRWRVALLIVVAAGLGGCDLDSHNKTSSPSANKAMTYPDCLGRAVASGGNRPVEEVRALCAEATGTLDAAYTMTPEGSLQPSNAFTRCYDTEKKALEAKSVEQAVRLAKLSCKYPDMK